MLPGTSYAYIYKPNRIVKYYSKMIQEYVNESVSWGDPLIFIEVYAPTWYKSKHAHDDLYSHKILVAKDNSRDESPFFMPYVKRMLEKLIQEGKIPEKIDLVVTMPSKDGLQRLTLEEVGKNIAKRFGGKLKNLINKIPSERRNKGITTVEEKMEKTKNQFKLKGEKPNGVVFLLDDQKTTGSTLIECTRILLEGGANKVHCFCLSINRNVDLFGE